MPYQMDCPKCGRLEQIWFVVTRFMEAKKEHDSSHNPPVVSKVRLKRC